MRKVVQKSKYPYLDHIQQHSFHKVERLMCIRRRFFRSLAGGLLVGVTRCLRMGLYGGVLTCVAPPALCDERASPVTPVRYFPQGVLPLLRQSRDRQWIRTKTRFASQYTMTAAQRTLKRRRGRNPKHRILLAFPAIVCACPSSSGQAPQIQST